MYISSDSELRRALINEVNKVQQLIHKTIDVSYAEFYDSKGINFSKDFHSIEEISNRMKSGNVVVVTEGDCIVATGASLGNKIFGVFVLPEKQRQGYGKKVMEELERLLKSQGFDRVVLDISLASLDFYKSLRYVITGETNIALEDGSHFKYFNAEKELGL
ncbi:MAG: GNAT family N-acetyltransferase [Nostocaceae cyanobacterium]|nr:GNAT family N-acetyltransferase [Nostocaceae cyanobacterium]